jgi:hypothetical protein
VAQILSDLAWFMRSNTVAQATPLENMPNTLDDFSVSQKVDLDIIIDGKCFADGDPQVIGSSGNSHTRRASHQAEGVTSIEPTVIAGTSRSRRVCTLSRRMAESMSKGDFYGTSGMHYMANQSSTVFDETPEDLFHDHHLELHVRIPTRNLYAVTQHLLTRRNFLFLNSLEGFQRSLGQRAHFINFIFFILSFLDSFS